MTKVNTSIRLQPAIHEKVVARAKEEHRSFNNMIELILTEYFSGKSAQTKGKEEKAAKVSIKDAVSDVRVMLAKINRLTHSSYKPLELLDTGTGYTMVDEEKQKSIQVPGCIPYLQRVYWALLDDEASQSAFALASMNALEEYTEEKYRELTS